eukprot:10621519-Heterocapsa_arctica.AAC.1
MKKEDEVKDTLNQAKEAEALRVKKEKLEKEERDKQLLEMNQAEKLKSEQMATELHQHKAAAYQEDDFELSEK